MSVIPLINSDPTPCRSSQSSTRIFSGICGSADVFGLDKRETATLLSIAHLTSWSAELIANKVREYLGISVSPEKVWEIYKGWEDARNENQLDGLSLDEDIKTNKAMVGILRQYDIEPNFYASPLSQTPRPVSVPFNDTWYPACDDSPLLVDFTERTRRICVSILGWRAEEKNLSKPAPQELVIMNKLGYHVSVIIMALLPRWVNEMIQVITQLPFTKAIDVSLDNLEIIENYVRIFKHKWEEKFGTMDGAEVLWTPNYIEPAFIRIRSSGEAAKMFFYLMLLTRLQSLENRRLTWRAIVGFIDVPLKNLPVDLKDCHICREPLGVPNSDDKVEMPIRAIACCGNYFGANCLRKWYCEFENTKCPLCKWTASTSFLEKLYYEENDAGIDVASDLDAESAIARMGSIRSPTPDNDDDLEDGERVVSPHGLRNGQMSDDDDNDDGKLEDGEIKD